MDNMLYEKVIHAFIEELRKQADVFAEHRDKKYTDRLGPKDWHAQMALLATIQIKHGTRWSEITCFSAHIWYDYVTDEFETPEGFVPEEVEVNNFFDLLAQEVQAFIQKEIREKCTPIVTFYYQSPDDKWLEKVIFLEGHEKHLQYLRAIADDAIAGSRPEYFILNYTLDRLWKLDDCFNWPEVRQLYEVHKEDDAITRRLEELLSNIVYKLEESEIKILDADQQQIVNLLADLLYTEDEDDQARADKKQAMRLYKWSAKSGSAYARDKAGTTSKIKGGSDEVNIIATLKKQEAKVVFKVKKETAQAYCTMIEFLNEQLNQGMHAGYELAFSSKIGDNTDNNDMELFWSTCVSHPETHDLMRNYIAIQTGETLYDDGSSEDRLMCTGSYAAIALAMQDPTAADLSSQAVATVMSNAGEYAHWCWKLIQDHLDKYGITEENMDGYSKVAEKQGREPFANYFKQYPEKLKELALYMKKNDYDSEYLCGSE